MKNLVQVQQFFLLVFLFLTISFFNFYSQTSIIKKQLHSNWEFQQKGTKKWYKATVPGCVHTDLMENGIIQDPYYRINE